MTEPDTTTSAAPVPPAAPPQPEPTPHRPARPGRRGRLLIGGAVLAAFVVGAGAAGLVLPSRSVSVLALTPAPIATMQEWSPVAVKGQVAEIYGNKFVVSDDSGRALVETGPAGEGGGLVKPSETVTVQGRFERGSIRAAAIIHADGHADAVGPAGPPHGPGPMGMTEGPHWLRSLLHPRG